MESVHLPRFRSRKQPRARLQHSPGLLNPAPYSPGHEISRDSPAFNGLYLPAVMSRQPVVMASAVTPQADVPVQADKRPLCANIGRFGRSRLLMRRSSSGNIRLRDVCHIPPTQPGSSARLLAIIARALVRTVCRGNAPASACGQSHCRRSCRSWPILVALREGCAARSGVGRCARHAAGRCSVGHAYATHRLADSQLIVAVCVVPMPTSRLGSSPGSRCERAARGTAFQCDPAHGQDRRWNARPCRRCR